MQQVTTNAYRQDALWRYIITGCGLALIVLTLSIGAFLCYKGVGTFTTYNHSIAEFLFSADWAPSDSAEGGGKVGAAIFIFGSVITCALALAIATPFSLATAIFMTEISPELGKRFVQPAVEIFVGIPSVVYGWIGLTILVPLIKNIFNLRFGFSVLAAGIVLAVMIFPTITSLAADALRSIPKSYRAASYGLGATRWQTIAKVVVPAAVTGLMTAVILGLARAFGEALAVAMVIGKMRAFPSSLLAPTNNLTAAIAADMGGAMEGSGIGNLFFNTIYLVFLSLLVSVPLGVAAGIYMAEYAKQGKFTKFLRMCIETMSSLPSIVVGLFGYLVFIVMTGSQWNLFSGALAVSILSIPLIMTVTEDAFKSLPQGYKRGSLAMGATLWQTIYKVLLPACLPRIMTGVILAAGRGFGEAAALLYTAGMSTDINWNSWNLLSPTCPLNPFRPGETLALHIWASRTEALAANAAQMANLSSAILMLLVLSFSLGARYLSTYLDTKTGGSRK